MVFLVTINFFSTCTQGWNFAHLFQDVIPIQKLCKVSAKMQRSTNSELCASRRRNSISYAIYTPWPPRASRSRASRSARCSWTAWSCRKKRLPPARKRLQQSFTRATCEPTASIAMSWPSILSVKTVPKQKLQTYPLIMQAIYRLHLDYTQMRKTPRRWTRSLNSDSRILKPLKLQLSKYCI